MICWIWEKSLECCYNNPGKNEVSCFLIFILYICKAVDGLKLTGYFSSRCGHKRILKIMHLLHLPCFSQISLPDVCLMFP